MHIGSQKQFAASKLANRLQSLLGNMDVGNGTSEADAVASALELDMRISGRKDGVAVLDALTDEEIHDLGFRLSWAATHGNSRDTLPLGTIIESQKLGDISIGGEHWILEAGRPGLHPMEAARRGAHGANLDLLLSHITRLTRRKACKRIGLPAPVFIVDVDDRHLLQFPPFAEAGGVVLQRWANGTSAPRFSAALPDQILEYAKSIVEDMQTLWSKRKEIAARAKWVRDLAETAASEHGAQVQLVAIDLSHQRDTTKFDMYVHYQGVDESMRDGTVLDFIPCRDHITREFYSPPSGVGYRPAERAALHALGADGRIEAVAAAVAAAAPGGMAPVLAKLATDYETMVTLPTAGAPMFATLYWRDGTIKAEISMAGKLDYCRSRLELYGAALPETIVASLVGRAVDSFATLPFACPFPVMAAETMNSGVRLKLEVGEQLINLATGRMWPDPSPQG